MCYDTSLMCGAPSSQIVVVAPAALVLAAVLLLPRLQRLQQLHHGLESVVLRHHLIEAVLDELEGGLAPRAGQRRVGAELEEDLPVDPWLAPVLHTF